MKIEDISNKFNVQHGAINMAIQKTITCFQKLIKDPHDHMKLFSKFEKFCDNSFMALDATDIEKRNLRIAKLRTFEKYFLPRPLNYYNSWEDTLVNIADEAPLDPNWGRNRFKK